MWKAVLLAILLGLVGLGVWLRERAASESEDRRAGAASAPPTLAGEREVPGFVGAGAPPAPRSEGLRAVYGRVLDGRTGRPVEDARVTAFSYEDRRTTSARTEPDGGFVLAETANRDGSFHLVVAAGGYARSAETSVRAVERPRRVLLQPEAAIEGRLVEEADGTPIPRFRVLAAPYYARGARVEPTAITTVPDDLALAGSAEVRDDGGRFRLGGLPPGDYALVFLVEGRAPHCRGGSGTVYEWRGYPVAAGSAADVGTVKMPPAGPIVIRVIDAGTEEPLAGVTVTAVTPLGGREIGQRLEPLGMSEPGEYVLPLLMEQGRVLEGDLLLEREGYGPARTYFYGQQRGERLDVRLGAACALLGTALREGDAARAGLLVVVRRQGGDDRMIGSAVTDAEGRFRIEPLPAGVDLKVVLFDRSTDFPSATVPLRLRAGERRVLDIGGGEAGIRGTFRIDGEPVVGGRVLLEGGPEGLYSESWSGRDGGFRYQVPPGRYVLSLRSSPQRVSLHRNVDVPPSGVADASVDVAGSIRGTVEARLPDGSRPETEDLEWVDDLDTLYAAGSSRAGDAWTVERALGELDFVFRVPAGAVYRIELGPESGAFLLPEPPRVDLTSAADVSGVVVRLVIDPQVGRIELEVRDSETGAAVPRAEVAYEHLSSSGGGTGSDAGTLVFDGMSVGRYRFTVKAPLHVPTQAAVELTLARPSVRERVVLPRADAVRVTGLDGLGRGGPAGLLVGDLLRRYDDRPIRNGADLAEATSKSAPGDRVRLEVLRGSLARSLTVPGGPLGIAVENAPLPDSAR